MELSLLRRATASKMSCLNQFTQFTPTAQAVNNLNITLNSSLQKLHFIFKWNLKSLTFMAQTTPWQRACFFFNSIMLRALTAPVLEENKEKKPCKFKTETIIKIVFHIIVLGIGINSAWLLNQNMKKKNQLTVYLYQL